MGTPRGGSIELIEADLIGGPIGGKRTAAAPMSNPPLRPRVAHPSAAAHEWESDVTVKDQLTVTSDSTV
jgi:hypothetical protein